MKARIILNIMLIACFVSCQAKKENKNIMLTDFTKDLISLYVNDAVNINEKNRKNEIIIITVADTSYYYLSVFANNHKEYKFCRDDFLGQTLYLGLLIRVFGDENNMFYSVGQKNKRIAKCKQNNIIYDPNVWDIAFYKDKSFNKMRTYKIRPSEDISTIQSLVEQYFKVSQTIGNEVYQLYEIENEAKFVLGEDSLRQIISSNFKKHKVDSFGKIPLVVNIIVDKKGKATLEGIVKSSNDIEIDNEALRVAELICKYDFIPASHRGEKVNAVYPIIFLKEDVIP